MLNDNLGHNTATGEVFDSDKFCDEVLAFVTEFPNDPDYPSDIEIKVGQFEIKFPLNADTLDKLGTYIFRIQEDILDDEEETIFMQLIGDLEDEYGPVEIKSDDF